MKISELTAALSKVSQIAGDIDVILHDVEHGGKTFIHSLDVHLDPTSGGASSVVEVEHSSEPPPVAQPVQQYVPGEPAPS